MTPSVQAGRWDGGVQVSLTLGAWIWVQGQEIGISQTVGPQQDLWVPVLTVLWERERQHVGSLPNLLLGGVGCVSVTHEFGPVWAAGRCLR